MTGTGGNERAGRDGAAGADRLAARLLRTLARRGETVAVAESLTGGLVAAELTAVPGASQVFRGSVTAYATELKRELLGVDGQLLAERGAVDAETAGQMAEGVRKLLTADWGVATTGVAGPDTQDGEQVGTVFVAVAGSAASGKPVAVRLNLEGDRARIRQESVQAALRLLFGELIENAGTQDTEHSGGNGCLQP